MSAPTAPAGNGGTPQYGNVSREMLKSLTGLELLQGMKDGHFPGPPMAELMSIGIAELGPGRAVFSGFPARKHYNPSGTVHGGFAATLLDSAMGCAVHTLVPKGQGSTTLEIKVNFVRALFENSGEVRCEANVINMGKTVATAEGKILDGKGRLIAHGTTTCLIFEIP